ncbi:MAG: sigma-70 family RNA polymerase sigma factor [Candidatus Zixiibacteriota bacterium]|nr:MAG: sigma-70 family RNA polymerase sigma factor [candidate division Zixibacteria bacterium]
MSDAEDRKLIRTCLKGDKAIYERLIEKYQKPLFNVALRITGDYEDARDITQTVFVNAYDRLRSYSPKFKFFSWIYRMAVNESLNVVNRKKLTVGMDRECVSGESTPEDDFRSNQSRQRVEDAVGALPLDYRVAVILRYWIDLPYRDIAYILDIQEKTVKSRLYTARRMLAEVFVKQGITTNE